MEGSWTLILSLLAGAVGIYYYLYRHVNYFKKKGIPYAKATPILGNMGPNVFRKISHAENIQRLYNMQPDVKYVGVFEFGNPVVMLRDPELVKSVTIKNFDSFQDHKMSVDDLPEPLFSKNLFILKGERWRDMRALLSPSFTSSKMKIMFKLISQCGIELADYLKEKASQPIEMEMKDIFSRYTNDVIATSAFGISVNSLRDRENEFYTVGKEALTFDGIKIMKGLVYRMSPFLGKLFNLRIFGEKIDKFFTDVIGSTIAIREEKGIVRNDMLQLMMQARGKSEKIILSTEDITAQAFIFFAGGFETSATLMSFAAYEIGINPDVQKKLQEEIDAVLAEGEGEVTYDSLHSMPYLDAVINESLRLYPPAAAIDRLCTKTFELPPAASGFPPYTVKAGNYIWLPCYGIHRDPKYFPNPEKFDPERFSEKNKDSLSTSAYFPFGFGPRMCIGNRFALMEIKLALFYLLANCNLSPSPKTPIPMTFDPKQFVVAPKNGFWLTIQKRF